MNKSLVFKSIIVGSLLVGLAYGAISTAVNNANNPIATQSVQPAPVSTPVQHAATERVQLKNTRVIKELRAVDSAISDNQQQSLVTKKVDSFVQKNGNETGLRSKDSIEQTLDAIDSVSFPVLPDEDLPEIQYLPSQNLLLEDYTIDENRYSFWLDTSPDSASVNLNAAKDYYGEENVILVSDENNIKVWQVNAEFTANIYANPETVYYFDVDGKSVIGKFFRDNPEVSTQDGYNQFDFLPMVEIEQE